MKIAILGFGREGKTVLKFLRRSPQYKNAGIWILDKNPNLTTSQVVNIKTGRDYLKNLDKFDIVFRSPGVPYNLPGIQSALKKGVKFSSATKLFFENFNGEVIGITGTKGKGTTATLLYEILRASRKPVYLAGNIGKPVLEILPKLRRNSFVILELSSFQLQDLKNSPNIAVVLDIFPDHMDSHKNMAEYLDAKANIARYQKKSDKIFYFGDNKYSKWIAQKSRGKKIGVQPKKFGLFNKDNLKIPGYHNFKNAVMAASVALSLGCPKNTILKVIRNFRGNEHRLELVRCIKISNQSLMSFANIREMDSRLVRENKICFYNDSASTNPQTAIAAIKAFKEPKILIAGGKDKNLNYSPLAQALKNSNTKMVVLFGENKRKIYKAVRKSGVPIKIVKDLKKAIEIAYHHSKLKMTPPGIRHWRKQNSKLINVVFSPASTSFDMFHDYAERGKRFKEIVQKLK